MILHFARLEVISMPRFLRNSITLSLLVFGVCVSASFAKQPSLTVIELYDGPTGAAYLQLEDVLINGKSVFRDCTSFQTATVDKSAYAKMQKVTPSSGAVLERDNDGVLRYKTGEGQSLCLVPDNVKFDHNALYSLSDLADQATLTGVPTGSSGVAAADLPPLKKGVKLVFVTAPDPELAEFLRAQKAADTADWVSYLSKYPASSHASDANLALALLYVEAGEVSLGKYQKSMATMAPSFSDLNDSKSEVDRAQAVMPSLEQTVKLSDEIRKELTAIAEKGRGELNAYNVSFQARTPGYIHLQNARKLSEVLSGIDIDFPAGKALLEDAMTATNKFDRALTSAESSVEGKQMDIALEFVTPLRQFSNEEPRIEAVVDAVYAYDLQLAKQFAEAANWESAITQLKKTASVTDTAEVRDSLAEAGKKLVLAQDKAAAEKAQASSRQLELQHDSVGAFEVLYSLPSSQKALVADDIERLKNGYIQSAVQTAKELQKAHSPIRGLGDEIGIEKAYSYLQRA